jgi:hypothetical protein
MTLEDLYAWGEQVRARTEQLTAHARQIWNEARRAKQANAELRCHTSLQPRLARRVEASLTHDARHEALVEADQITNQ